MLILGTNKCTVLHINVCASPLHGFPFPMAPGPTHRVLGSWPSRHPTWHMIKTGKPINAGRNLAISLRSQQPLDAATATTPHPRHRTTSRCRAIGDGDGDGDGGRWSSSSSLPRPARTRVDHLIITNSKGMVPTRPRRFPPLFPRTRRVPRDATAVRSTPTPEQQQAPVAWCECDATRRRNILGRRRRSARADDACRVGRARAFIRPRAVRTYVYVTPTGTDAFLPPVLCGTSRIVQRVTVGASPVKVLPAMRSGRSTTLLTSKAGSARWRRSTQ